MKKEKMKVKCQRIIASIILMIILSISSCILPVNATTTEVKQVTIDYTGAVISVKSDKEIQKIAIYKKDSNGNFVKIFESDESGYTERNFLVSRYRLSENNKTSIKVIITTDGEEVQDLDIDKIPEAPEPISTPTPTSSETTTPSQTPSPTTTPTESPDPTDKVSKITLNKASITLDMPNTKTATLKATVSPSGSSTKLTWSTSNKYIARVDSTGKVTAVSPGSCTITVKTTSGKTATCKVTVKFRGKTVGSDEKIYFIDVDSADCILLYSQGKYGMIDTATGGSASAKKIKNMLKDLGIKELEWVLITHYDIDHWGGYSKISSQCKIKNVYIKKVSSRGGYKSVKSTAQKAGTKINYVGSKCDSFKFGNFSFKLYNLEDMTSKYGISRQNINSIVSIASVNNKRIAFMGDFTNVGSGMGGAQVKIATTICNKTAKQIGDIDIYKIAHHGYNGNRDEELKYYKPEYAVLTNSGQISSSTSKRVKKYTGTKHFYVAGTGTVIMSISKTGTVSCAKLPDGT